MNTHMADSASGQRAKRRCAARRNLPSAAHYVGYVEDEETPEMIMKKFEELERVMKGMAQPPPPQPQEELEEAGPSHSITHQSSSDGAQQGRMPSREEDGGEPKQQGADLGCHESAGLKPAGAEASLTDEQLMEVFRRTSIFNVSSALGGNEALMGMVQEGALSEELWTDAEHSDVEGSSTCTSTGAATEDLSDFWSDNDTKQGGIKGACGGAVPRPKPTLPPKPPKPARVPPAGPGPQPSKVNALAHPPSSGRRSKRALIRDSHAQVKQRHLRKQILQYQRDIAYMTTTVWRKPKSIAREDLQEVRIPGPPLPASWGRSVKPWEPPVQLVPSTSNAHSTPQLPCSDASPAQGAIKEERHDTCITSSPSSLTNKSGDGISKLGGCSPVPNTLDPTGSHPEPPKGQAPLQSPSKASKGSASPAPNCLLLPSILDAPAWHRLTQAPLGPSYLAVLINPGWKWQATSAGQMAGNASAPEAATTGPASCVGAANGQPPCAAAISLAADKGVLMDRFRQIPIPQLCPYGFVFVWADKSEIQCITKELYAWGFQYVENLTWVWLAPNNTFVQEAYPYTRSSHRTLMIFRKDGEVSKRIALMHQRNVDVIIDCPLRPASSSGRDWMVPEAVYSTIETMLPDQSSNADPRLAYGSTRFLELWAPQTHSRPGWVHVQEEAA